MPLTNSKKRIPGMLVLTVLLALVLAACGELTPTGKADSFLLNEVYTGSAAGGLQWVEILANAPSSDEASTLDLSGITLRTSKGSLDLSKLKGTAYLPAIPGGKGARYVNIDPANPVPAGGYIVIASNIATFQATFPGSKVVPLDGSGFLGNLDPNNDAITLYNGNDLLDQVGWGNPTQDTLSKVGASGDVNLKLTAPASSEPPKSLGRTPPTGPRDPGKPGLFTVHETVSPGGIVIQPADKYNFVLNQLTNIITIIGGLLLLLVFVMIAVIARRFQTLAQQRTFWQALLLAPVGILIYDIVTILAFTGPRGNFNDQDRWIGFGALLISGIACAAVINVFRNIAKDILASE